MERGSWWATWRPFWLACLLAVLLLPLLLIGKGMYDTRVPLLILFPFGALAAVVREYVHVPLLPVLLGQLPLYALITRAGARLGHTRAAATLIALLHVLAMALGGPVSWGPSLDEYRHAVREAAGPGARDCGSVPLPDPRGAAVACAQAALAQGRSFSVAFQVMGIDSTVYLGLAHRAGGGTTYIGWDGDAYGGSNLVPMRRIHQKPCAKPSIQDADDLPPITCDDRADGA